MYAVIKTGGKQYKVAQDDVLTVERLTGEAGDTLSLDQVLMVGGGEGGLKMGSPVVDGALVKAEVVSHVRGPHLTIFKKRRRKNHRRKNGHRQDLTQIRIVSIEAGAA